VSDSQRIQVAIEAPAHSSLSDLLDYSSEQAVPLGSLVRVPLGKRVVLGLVWGDASFDAGDDSPPSDVAIKPITEALTALPPLSGSWRALLDFCAAYYQRSTGEVAVSVLPPELRKLDQAGLAQRVAKWLRAEDKRVAHESALTPVVLPELHAEQETALAQWALLQSELKNAATDSTTVLLHGVTGSGKTEVYLRMAADVLQNGQQALVLVPEINLTPQLEDRFEARFAQYKIVSLHSGLTPVQRLKNWVLAHLGQADLVLGTRLAVFASLPRLGLIVVDEEHDPSYKQQDGARYSARDLAVYRGHLEQIPVVLGSATPSLETWQRSQEGRYRCFHLPSRIGQAVLPKVRLVNMAQQPKVKNQAVSVPLLHALQQRLAWGDQSLVFLNRRGYAPVLHCTDCGWKSACAHCSAWRVFHKLDRTLRCHHCGSTDRVPRACPDCGNLDIAPMGRGTEQLEEQLSALLPGARIARIDADSVRGKGALQTQLGAVHAGEIDILVGTQMVTKGHDFRRMSLVAAINPDTSLFSSDFRAPERLFALLQQAAGRAGRDAEHAERSEMWVQTWNPQHALYRALHQHDFAAFAGAQLQERQSAALPPFAYLALLRADARSAEAARAFLQAATALAQTQDLAQTYSVTLCAPVPLPVARVANAERMQLLIESRSRKALQAFLARWLPLLHEVRSQQSRLKQPILRWAIDVDPLAI
jgi:primosomal protein N' (replication factor Y) (superfamily II helicase)